MPKKKEKVFVGMSGGVDSSVAAALLKRDGFDVVGVYMKCWQDGAACTSQDDERSARLAASHLGIPFYTWNFLKEYREKVVDYMLKGYAQGVTPNPDMMCNKEIKFGLFFEKAMRLGANFVATGHYARIVRHGISGKHLVPPQRGGRVARSAPDPSGPCSGACASLPENAVPHLLEAVDKNKDQSYFLSFIKPEVLAYVLFPIGEYTKPQVRESARKLGLPNAERKDSQGICFVGKVDVTDFLKEYIAPHKGEIVDMAGNVLGTHEGSIYYTIGQRSGLGLSGGPYYVVSKDQAANKVLVTKDEQDLQRKDVVIRDMNWMGGQPAEPLEVTARIRYRQDRVLATLIPREDKDFRLVFQEPQRAVTPGQFAVLYLNETLIGGGVIQ
ncbi:MAG: tRNA 2-thiouridine(34) synthase MnmA [Candidatus Wildermuthbacteria bacterium]|nr:tRNA 2-thiouridine(34) synthase MnmA [Candidatus Wildermuthbacteria bacterium]